MYFLGKARPVFATFTAYERRSCLKTMCESFKNRNNPSVVKTIMIDKDLQEVEVLKVAFPEADILLCHIHCESAFHSKLKNKDVEDLFINMMRADSYEKVLACEGKI